MRFLLIFGSIFISLITSSQTSFEYVLQTPEDQIPGSMLEDVDGNIICTVTNLENALLIKLDRYGNLTDSLRLLNSDGTCELMELVRISDSSFAAVGSYMLGEDPHLWFVKLDYDLNLLADHKYPVGHLPSINETHAILSSANSLVIAITLNYPPNVEMFEIDQSGMLLNQKYFNDPYFNLTYDLLEDTSTNQYKVVTLSKVLRVGCNILNLDMDFGLINNTGLSMYFDEQNSAKWLSDSTYLLSGRFSHSTKSMENDVGLLKLSKSDSIIDSLYLGKQYMVEWPALHDNMDFISKDKIFFVNYESYYSPNYQGDFPSNIVIHNLSSDMKVRWKHIYGGDAYYLPISCVATADSGFVVASIKNDYSRLEIDRDVHILKVNKNGLITGIDHTYETGDFKKRVCPNPFKEETRLHLQFDNPGSVKIIISDIQGKRIKTLLDSYMSKGEYQFSWNGTNDYGNITPDGVYLISILIDGMLTESLKVIKK